MQVLLVFKLRWLEKFGQDYSFRTALQCKILQKKHSITLTRIDLRSRLNIKWCPLVKGENTHFFDTFGLALNL